VINWKWSARSVRETQGEKHGARRRSSRAAWRASTQGIVQMSIVRAERGRVRQLIGSGTGGGWSIKRATAIQRQPPPSGSAGGGSRERHRSWWLVLSTSSFPQPAPASCWTHKTRPPTIAGGGGDECVKRVEEGRGSNQSTRTNTQPAPIFWRKDVGRRSRPPPDQGRV